MYRFSSTKENYNSQFDILFRYFMFLLEYYKNATAIVWEIERESIERMD